MQSAGIQAEVLLSAMVGVEWQNFLPRLLGRRGDLPSLGGIRNVHGVGCHHGEEVEASHRVVSGGWVLLVGLGLDPSLE